MDNPKDFIWIIRNPKPARQVEIMSAAGLFFLCRERGGSTCAAKSGGSVGGREERERGFLCALISITAWTLTLRQS
jgi:hypothetical protein